MRPSRGANGQINNNNNNNLSRKTYFLWIFFLFLLIFLLYWNISYLSTSSGDGHGTGTGNGEGEGERCRITSKDLENCQLDLVNKEREIRKMKLECNPEKEILALEELLQNKNQEIAKLQMKIKFLQSKYHDQQNNNKDQYEENKKNKVNTWATSLIGSTASYSPAKSKIAAAGGGGGGGGGVTLHPQHHHHSIVNIAPLYSISDLQTVFHKDYKGSTKYIPQESDILYGDLTVKLYDKELTVDEIIMGYQIIFEHASLFTYTNFFGVSLQQDPSDAFALMDLIWRLKPDLLIELGTAGGGSAFFYGMIMTAYNPKAHVITMDPKRLIDWNIQNVNRVCPHCISGRDTPLWNSDTIHFLPLLPTDPNTTAIVDEYISLWKPQTILVMDDSNHLTDIVLGNIQTYAKYVTPGSYLIVQDMKMERLYRNPKSSPPMAVKEFLSSPLGQDFEIDRTYEYYLYTQHAKGFLRKKIPHTSP